MTTILLFPSLVEPRCRARTLTAERLPHAPVSDADILRFITYLLQLLALL